MKHKFHLYEKINIAKPPKKHYVFQCMLPGCSHYKHETTFMNAEGLCWDCRVPFLITKELINIKPLCANCIRKRKEEEAQKILRELNKLVGDKV